MNIAARTLLAAVPIVLALAGCTVTPKTETSTRPKGELCPAPDLPNGTSCYSGQVENGAFYWIAIPPNWNKVLVVHAHGGPDLGAARLERASEDLKRWSVIVKAGYAYVGSSYRRGGFGVTMAADDVERSREIFVRRFGEPRRTILHGQSYGGAVASKAAERFAVVDGKRGPYDGVLLTSGVLGGGTRAYDFRLDLRAVYQQVCRNLPTPDEAQYPLWAGLPMDSKLTRADVAARVEECTGVGKPAAQRTEQQKANLAAITGAVRIKDSSLQGHMNWAVFLFQDLVQRRLDGRNPFGNTNAQYPGTPALNAGVARYVADPVAVAALKADSDPEGKINVPVLTMHAIDDPVAFVELEALYRDTVVAAGNGNLLVQTFTNESEHSYLSDPQYPALFKALLDWIDKGIKPTPDHVATLCRSYEKEFANTCRFNTGYRVPSLDTRVAPRQR